MTKKKKKYAVPTGPKKGAGGSRGISKLKGHKAAAQTAVAAGGSGDGLFAAPGTHVAKKRKAAPEDPGLEDADQYMQPARKKKKKEQQQQVAPLSADSTAEREQCTHKYIADAAQPQQLQGQQRKQKWWQPKQPLKQKQKQKRKKALAQQLQLRAQKRNGRGALQPNKAAVAAAGGQLSWCAARYPMQGAPGAVTVTQWHAMAAALPDPSRASRHLEAGKTFFCLDTNALVGGSGDVQQAWAAIQAAGGGSVQLMVPLKVVYEVKAGRNHLVEGRVRQPFDKAMSLLNALMGSHSCCRVQRDDEVYRGHPKKIANQKGDSAILDCLLYFTSLNATVVLCTNDVKFAEHAAQHNVRTITHSELPLAVAGALWGSRAASDDAVPGVSPATLFQAGVQAAMQPASQLMADMQRLANTQLLVSMQLTAMAEQLAAAQQPARAPLQALQAPGPCLRLPPAQPPPLMRLMPPPLWVQEPHLTYALHPS